ncbi:MAG: efflux RND transporter periplasmic adaptor subunit [Polyangiaceae bacterium]|nr:efflux RND transporter periplasmic adaptor subunit [Polyangiaceae bacterium]
MAVVRWLLLLSVVGIAGATVWRFWGPAEHAHSEAREARYYCPMHPQIRSPDPGECPICFMRLEPIPADRRQPAVAGAASPAPATSGAPSATGAQAASGAPAGSTSAPPEVVAVTVGADQQRAIGLVTAPVERATVGGRLRVPGVVSATDSGRSEVRVRAPGFVERVAVRQTGERVRRGQPLVYVYSPEIYRAQAEFLAASRWSEAAPAGAPPSGAPELVAAARRGLELLGLSRGDLDRISRTGQPIRAIAVRAPASGTITRFGAVLGARADPETVLYEISDLSTVWVVASVHERDLGAVPIGAPARFSSAAADATALTARVDSVEPSIDEPTRTSRVRLVVRNPDGRLLPGQYGEVELELPGAPRLLVPRDAVVRTGERTYVYVAAPGDRFEPRRVTAGREREGRVEILAGLSEGERVVTRGGFMLDSESRLQASLAATPAAGGASSPAHRHGSEE